MRYAPKLFQYLSFWGPMGSHDKVRFLYMIKYDWTRTNPAAYTDFVMVGNRYGDPNVLPTSNDNGAAMLAGWRFISETDFANGKR